MHTPLYLQFFADMVDYDDEGMVKEEKGSYDFENAPHMSKRLHEQKKLVMKLCKQLTNITRHHRMIRNEQGLLSLENDNIARYIYDMGLLIRMTGREVIQHADTLQHTISKLRESEDLQIKQELSDNDEPPWKRQAGQKKNLLFSKLRHTQLKRSSKENTFASCVGLLIVTSRTLKPT